MRPTLESTPSAPAPWHARGAEEVARSLGTGLEEGLSSEEARRRPASARLNEVPAWRLALALFAGQWKGSVILILCAAALAFWLMGHPNDAAGIAFSVAFAVALGFLTDYRSQKSLAALSALNAPTASVIRDGIMVEIPAGDVVRGDLVVLRAGAKVPADGRLLDAGELSLQEAALTGESEPARKRAQPLPAGTPLAERANMAYAGSTVLTGTGRMVATETGLDTELGRIGRLVRDYQKDETPLEIQVESLGRRLGLLVVALSAAATLAGLLLGHAAWEMIETGFLLAVAAIPEGLPAVNTVALAGGVRRMVLARALVRRLTAVETLGSVDVICTDKTGTLTENVMRAAVVCLPGRRLEVSGSGYSPDGGFHEGTALLDPAGAADLQSLLRVAALCNNATLESHDGWHVHGSPTEGALLTLAAQGGVDLAALRRVHPRLIETPFTSERKRMSVVVSDQGGGSLALVKGAVGILLPLCSLSGAAREEIRLEAAKLAGEGLRVLGLAQRQFGPEEEQDPESGLQWVGMVGLLDPPRRSAAQAVGALARAGVRTIIVTGDHRDTAVAIAARVGLPSEAGAVCDAAGLADMLARGAWDALKRVAIVARVSPEDKLRLVEALRGLGHVVAMTGDGINDAPALKAADIGVAMGYAAADVAKEAADIVVTDGEYGTLTAAVEEGRRIYANLQRAARYLLLCSMSNIGLMAGALALRLPLPMTALQLLWLNLVVHIFPAISLAIAPNPRRFLEEPPRSRAASLLGWGEIGAVTLRSFPLCVLALAIFRWNLPGGEAAARSAAMASLALGLLAQSFPMVSGARGWTGVRICGAGLWLSLGASLAILAAMLYFPPLRDLLGAASLAPRQWAAPALGALICMELVSWKAFDRPSRTGEVVYGRK